MTDEERDIIVRFIQRVSGAAPAVPGGVPPALPPVDQTADHLIGDLFAHYPEARYRLTQTAFVQEAAIKEAQARVQALETELQSTRAALQVAQASQPAAPPPRSSFFSGVFGGPAPRAPVPQMAGQPVSNPWGPAAAPAYPAPPPSYAGQSQYAPPGQPGMPRAGAGFLGSALTTAAGVAGGVVAGNALMGLFEGHGGGMGGGMGGGLAGGFGGQAAGQPINETIINNYGDAANPQTADYRPWGEPADVSGTSEALNDGYWSKDSVYETSNDASDGGSANFSDDTDV